MNFNNKKQWTVDFIKLVQNYKIYNLKLLKTIQDEHIQLILSSIHTSLILKNSAYLVNLWGYIAVIIYMMADAR